VTVIEHFRIWQFNQISLSLIINAADNSATTLEITTKKPMQKFRDAQSVDGECI